LTVTHACIFTFIEYIEQFSTVVDERSRLGDHKRPATAFYPEGNRPKDSVRRKFTTLPELAEQQTTQVSWVQATFSDVCRAKNGGLALHFEVESAWYI